MATSDDTLESCQECGATIYPEHLQKHTAERFHGKLLCPHCLQEKRAGAGGDLDAIQVEGLENAPESDNPRIPLAADDPTSDLSASQEPHKSKAIRAFGSGITMAQAADEVKFQRPLRKNVPHAIRCRTFHAKLNEASINYLDRMINEWADAHEEIEIKFATSTIGVFEGKHADPNLIVTVFY